MHHQCITRAALVALVLGCVAAQAQTFDPQVICGAMRRAGDGYSSDELLLRDDLRQKFLQLVANDTGITIDRSTERAALLELLKLRKAGKLNVPATRRGKPVDDAVAVVAEIAARAVTDRHRISSDVMLCDPKFRSELQTEAELIHPGVDSYSVGKAVLALRKKRALRPELVLQVADWGREVRTFSLDQLRTQLDADEIPNDPGIYLFRGRNGYLYIGEAADLAKRLQQHSSGSDRESLADYLAIEESEGVSVELHIFPADSPAKRVVVRRAYESELIRSREPKFNVRP